MASMLAASAPLGGATASLLEQDAELDELYDQLLDLRDRVILGSHPTLSLPQDAIERLKATMIAPDAQSMSSQHASLDGGVKEQARITDDTVQLQSPHAAPTSGSALPGLQASAVSTMNGAASSSFSKPSSAAGIDPIFLMKADSLVRAERRLKRERLERDLQAQEIRRKLSSRDKERDAGTDILPSIDVDLVLSTALDRVVPVSGLKVDEQGSIANSSFDENDYYSSQVQSAWSSPASSRKGSDRAPGAFTADFERLDGAQRASSSKHPAPTHEKRLSGPTQAVVARRLDRMYMNEPGEVYEPEGDEEDDEYTPPDAGALDSSRADGLPVSGQQETEHENSDYEPGEILDVDIPPSHEQDQGYQRPVPEIPIIRNHLTHIAAPQPNRVSPLATAKGPSIELELVNGRPEVVQKPQRIQHYVRSGASTASPPAHVSSSKKKKNKKRKREIEPPGRAKKRRDRQTVLEAQTQPTFQEPYVKEEPISPPPFGRVAELPFYNQPHYQQQLPSQAGFVTPAHGSRAQYDPQLPDSGLLFAQGEPIVGRVASAAAYQPLQNESQDVVSIASIHHAQRPRSPRFSPVAPYRTTSMTYGQPQAAHEAQLQSGQHVTPHRSQPAHEHPQYRQLVQARPSPQQQEYRDGYVDRSQSSAMMPPPPAPESVRRIMQDSHGNRFFVHEASAAPPPTPTYIPLSRASMAPMQAQRPPEPVYERAPSRATTAYAQPVLPQHVQPPQAWPHAPPPAYPVSGYDPADSRMLPPEVPSRVLSTADLQPRHIGDPGYPAPPTGAHGYATHGRGTEAPTSPVFQQIRNYGQMPPPAFQPFREQTSPQFTPRTYSVRPEQHQTLQAGYVRHTSMAPLPHAREEYLPQTRAVSVLPGTEYGAPSLQPTQYAYAQAPSAVKYVDQYGNEVFPQNVRQVGQPMYYQGA